MMWTKKERLAIVLTGYFVVRKKYSLELFGHSTRAVRYVVVSEHQNELHLVPHLTPE